MRNNLTADGVSLTNISFVHVPCERMWLRDHGPISVMTDNGVVFIDLDDLANSGLDEDLPTNLANIWGLGSYELPYIFCGGNFMVDSHNTLFTTTRLYSNNPSYSPTQINQDFETYMGINQIITVSAQHNDYWGHIDMQIKLLNDTTLIISSTTPGSGPNYDTLENNNIRLSALTAPNGQPYHIARVPHADDWKTYANSIILNNKVIVPTYNHPNDIIALQTYQQLLPNHQIVGVNANPIIAWEGSLHCITMQLFDDNQVSGIKSASVKNKPFSLFPNPFFTGSYLNILFGENTSDEGEIMISDAQGKLVHSISKTAGETKTTLYWPWQPGTYTVTLNCVAGTFSEKIICIDK
jgi:agmatine deiminase